MIKMKNIFKSFGKLQVLKNLNLEIEKNKVMCLLGPSGCGKSTILNILAGLDSNYSGTINGIEEQMISYVFQEARLIPWLTVEENLQYVLESHIENDLEGYIENYLTQVNLLEFKKSYPNELSGGMKQRVSLARAFAMPHEILLLDEPFQGLDISLKEQLMTLLEELIKHDNKTVVMVTHDIDEAKRLGNRIVRLIGQPIHNIEIL